MIAVIRDNNADVDIEETENIANSDISDRDRNNKGRRHLLRRCGAAALRRCGAAALRRCGAPALRSPRENADINSNYADISR